MKKYLVILCYLLIMITAFAAKAGEVVYREGEVMLKDATNWMHKADFGDTVKTGDTIITGANGYTEIETENSTVKISNSTVFTFLETETGGKKRNALTCVTGSVLLKISKITGTAPQINTLSANAGVRGTEFTLFAADNGSTLVAVNEGTVEVSAAGGVVVLAPDEGVEVAPGSPPGKKFKVLRGSLNYQDWNSGKIKEFLKEPVNSVYRLYSRMEDFIKEIEKIELTYNVNKKMLALERENLDTIKKKEGDDAAKAYYTDKVLPLEAETSYQVLNIRYYALSALSLRRYILSRLYMLMKIKYIADPVNQTYIDYLYAHNQLLQLFEKRIVPYLVEDDI